MNNDFDNTRSEQFDNDVSEFRTRSNWQQLKGKMKQAYGDLTDDDLEYSEGKQDEWFGKLGNKIGKAAQDVKDWVRGL